MDIFFSAYFLSILTASLYLMFDTGGQYGYLLQLARDPLRQMSVVRHRCLVWWSTRWTQRRRRVTARDSTLNAQNIHSFVFYSGKPFLSRDFLRECRLFYRFDIQLISCSVRQRDKGINLDFTPPSLLKSQLHYGWIEKRVHKEVNNHIMFFTQGRQAWSFITVPKRLNQYGSLHRKRSLPRQALCSIFSFPFTFYDSIWFNFTVKKEKKKKTNDLIKGRLDKILHIDTFKKQEALYQGEPFSLSQRRCNK